MDSFDSGLERESLICAQCGYCQPVCPIYDVLGWESSGPRARMALARQVSLGKTLDSDSARRVYQCTLCGHCREVCSTRIDTHAIWLQVRERLAHDGTLDQWPLANLRDNLANSGNITNEPGANRLLWQANLDPKPEGLNNQAGVELVYFVGCVAGLYPQAASIPESMVQILERAGVTYTTLGGEEICCGFPLLGLGLPERAAEMARRNLAAVRALGAQTLMTTCASCYHTWSRIYPQLLGEDLGLHVVHATEYLDELVSAGRLKLQPLEARVTYHDPCDLGRNTGVYEPPRRVIQAIPGVEFVEIESNRAAAQCCGGGGNLEAVDPELAAAIAARRVAQVARTGASILVTPCQQCKRTLQRAARKDRLKIKVLDLVELAAKQAAAG